MIVKRKGIPKAKLKKKMGHRRLPRRWVILASQSLKGCVSILRRRDEPNERVAHFNSV
jgi:hypothetical protein